MSDTTTTTTTPAEIRRAARAARVEAARVAEETRRAEVARLRAVAVAALLDWRAGVTGDRFTDVARAVAAVAAMGRDLGKRAADLLGAVYATTEPVSWGRDDVWARQSDAFLRRGTQPTTGSYATGHRGAPKKTRRYYVLAHILTETGAQRWIEVETAAEDAGAAAADAWYTEWMAVREAADDAEAAELAPQDPTTPTAH